MNSFDWKFTPLRDSGDAENGRLLRAPIRLAGVAAEVIGTSPLIRRDGALLLGCGAEGAKIVDGGGNHVLFCSSDRSVTQASFRSTATADRSFPTVAQSTGTLSSVTSSKTTRLPQIASSFIDLRNLLQQQADSIGEGQWIRFSSALLRPLVTDHNSIKSFSSEPPFDFHFAYFSGGPREKGQRRGTTSAARFGRESEDNVQSYLVIRPDLFYLAESKPELAVLRRWDVTYAARFAMLTITGEVAVVPDLRIRKEDGGAPLFKAAVDHLRSYPLDGGDYDLLDGASTKIMQAMSAPQPDGGEGMRALFETSEGKNALTHIMSESAKLMSIVRSMAG